MKLILSLFL